MSFLLNSQAQGVPGKNE